MITVDLQSGAIEPGDIVLVSNWEKRDGTQVASLACKRTKEVFVTCRDELLKVHPLPSSPR